MRTLRGLYRGLEALYGADFGRLVDRIFCQWRLLPGLDAPLRRVLRRFWGADMAGKLELAGA